MAENSDITWAVLEIKDRAERIFVYRAYYDGEHPFMYATQRWRQEFYEMFYRLRDNLCAAIVDAKADRIQLTGLTGADDKPRDAVSAALETMWARETLETRQGEITKNALKDGDAFVFVWPDQQNLARWYIQRGDRVCVEYAAEPQGTIAKAAKLWPTTEYTANNTRALWRLNLYYPDRTERYVTKAEVAGNAIPEKAASWDEYVPDTALDDDDEGVLSNSSVIPNDFGIVPVFPFPNNADLGAYGRSELDDVIPIQNALNKSVANMIVAGEFVAFPQRYLIGVEIDVDENGNPTDKEQKSAVDRILAIGNPQAKAGEFAAADLKNFIAEQDSLRAEMARISRTPLHYLLLSGDFPSGEALAAAERPLMSQIDDRIISLRAGYRAAASFSLTIEKVEHDPAEINPQFKDTRYRDPAGQAEEWRLKKELGIPDEQIWREMGYTEEQIKEFTEAKEERRLEMQASFDAGAGGVNPEATEPVIPGLAVA